MRGGNALDRTQSIIYVKMAEDGLGEVCGSLSQIARQVDVVNAGYKPASNNAAIYKVYNGLKNSLKKSMMAFGNSFQTLHKDLERLINEGSDSDKVRANISSHEYEFDLTIITDLEHAGIKDFSVTRDEISTLSSKIAIFIANTDQIINAYKKIWALADECNNVSLKDKAHECAELVRTKVAEFKEGFDKAIVNFSEAVDTYEGTSATSVEEAQQSFAIMNNALSQIDFRTLQADMNALEDNAASSWR